MDKDIVEVAKSLSRKRKCTVVITGKEDIIADENKIYIVKNGHSMMTNVVGTGCMATSVIGTFAAVEKDLAYASAADQIQLLYDNPSLRKQLGEVGFAKVHRLYSWKVVMKSWIELFEKLVNKK